MDWAVGPGPYPRSPPGPPRAVEQACTGAYPRTLSQIPPAGWLSCIVRPFSRPRLPGALFYVTLGLCFYRKSPPGCFLYEYFCHQNVGTQAAPVLCMGDGKWDGNFTLLSIPTQPLTLKTPASQHERRADAYFPKPPHKGSYLMSVNYCPHTQVIRPPMGDRG